MICELRVLLLVGGSGRKLSANLHNVSILHTARPSQTNTVIFNIILSLQITASRHAIKTDRGVFVAAVSNTCSYILVMVGDRACNDGNTVP
jgi:hypothetical protein